MSITQSLGEKIVLQMAPRIKFLHATQRLGKKRSFQGSLMLQGVLRRGRVLCRAELQLQHMVPPSLWHMPLNGCLVRAVRCLQKFTTSAAAINSRNVNPRVIRYIVIIALYHRLIFIPLCPLIIEGLAEFAKLSAAPMYL